MAASIMDGTEGGESEVRRWFEQGKTYAWMVQEYQRRYDLRVAPAMFSNRRSARGWERRLTRDDELIPWGVNRKHRWHRYLGMLRLEARFRRFGIDGIGEGDVRELASFRERLKESDAVIDYNPETERGFFAVPREPGDRDIVRQPTQARWSRRRAGN